MNRQDKQPLWSRNYLLLIVMGALTSTGFYMVNPCIAKYAVSTGATVAAAGVITGLFSITALVARPVSGLMADRLNRRLLLTVATVILGLSALSYSFARTVPTLVVVRVIHGIAFAISGTVNVVLIASLVPRNRLSEGVGYYGLANIFATAVGPSLGLGLGEKFSFQTSFILSSLVIGCGLILSFFIQIEIPSVYTAEKGIHLGDLISLRVLPLAILGGIFSMSNGIITSYLALVGDVRNIVGISVYFTLNALVLLFIRPFAGKLADRRGARAIVYPAMLLDGLALCLIGTANSLGMILAAAVSKAMGQGSGQLTLQSKALKTLPPEKSGVASSTFYIGGDVGQGIGPMLAGQVVDTLGAESTGYGIMFCGSGAVFLLGILGYFIYNKRMSMKDSKVHKSVSKVY